MSAPDPFPDTLEQLFGSVAAAPAAPADPAVAAEPPPAGGAPGVVLGG